MGQPLTIGGLHLEDLTLELPPIPSRILEHIWLAPTADNPVFSYREARVTVEEYVFCHGVTPIYVSGNYYTTFQKFQDITSVYPADIIHANTLYTFSQAIEPILSGRIYWRDLSGWSNFRHNMRDCFRSLEDLHVDLYRLSDTDFPEEKLRENIFDTPPLTLLEQKLGKPLSTTKKTMKWATSIFARSSST